PGLRSSRINQDVHVLRDAREQLRGVTNSLVYGAPGFRFYAAGPIRVEDHTVGTLAAADPRPRRRAGVEFSGTSELWQIVEQEFHRCLHGIEGVVSPQQAFGERAVSGIESDFAHDGRKNPSAAQALQSLIRAQGYSMAMVLELAALYAQVREDGRF